MKLFRVALVVVSALQLSLAWAEDGVLIEQMPSGISDATVNEISKAALRRRSWTITSTDADKSVKAELDKGVSDAHITIYRDGSSLKYSGEDIVQILPVKAGITGKSTQVDDLPKRWITYLRKDISRLMFRTAVALPRSPAPSTSSSLTDRLVDLKKLLDAGLITKDEYDAKRVEILKNL